MQRMMWVALGLAACGKSSPKQAPPPVAVVVDAAAAPVAVRAPTSWDAPVDAAKFPLVAFRAGLKTTHFHEADRTPAVDPPPGVFIKTTYARGADKLVAYETPIEQDGVKRPAIVWIAGGFDWGIGPSAWSPGEATNDQSAAALRPEGIVLMLPALRGTNENPGKPECFLGEVDDILAAAAHVAARPDVDPARVYLGGHSTGAVLALLAAASTDKFRAVFAFGPVDDPRRYGEDGCLPAEGLAADEYRARAPLAWIGSIVTPTWIIEGVAGNIFAAKVLGDNAPKAVQVLPVSDADHFSVLRPGSELVARAILADTGPGPTRITIDPDEISAALARP